MVAKVGQFFGGGGREKGRKFRKISFPPSIQGINREGTYKGASRLLGIVDARTVPRLSGVGREWNKQGARKSWPEAMRPARVQVISKIGG